MKMRITILALALVALGASTASADLLLDTRSSTGGSVLAISPATGSGTGASNITGIQLFANITNGTSTDGFSKLYYSIYSTYSGTNSTPTDLMRIKINASSINSINAFTISVWQDQGEDGINFVPFTEGGTTWLLTGPGNKVPTAQDLDGDGDLDRGTLGTQIQDTNDNLHGGVDLNQTSYSPIDSDGNSTGPDVELFFYSSTACTKFASVSVTRSANSGVGRGITQIYMVGKSFDSNWTENGVGIQGESKTGAKLTLYVTGTAHNGSGVLTINPADSGPNTADGSGSGGSANHFIWSLQRIGSSGWIQVANSTDSSGMDTLTYAALQAALGTAYGDYQLELETKWVDDGNVYGVVLPNNNDVTDSADLTTVHYMAPEPGTILFLAAGSAGLAFFRRRRGRK